MTQTVQAHLPQDSKVKILAGPFRDFIGNLQGAIPAHGKMTVTLSIYNRPVRVELDREQVKLL